MEGTVTSHIVSNANVCGGRPCIAGTRVRVWDVYCLYDRQGKSADEVVAAFPDLSLADVHAALAYYYDHKTEIDADMKAADEYVASLKDSLGPGPLSAKLMSREASGDSVSP